MERGPRHYTGKLSAPISLLCGTNISSNPAPIITWRNPRGLVVPNQKGYRHVRNETGAWLEIGCLPQTDIGNWTCTVTANKLRNRSPIVVDIQVSVIGKINNKTMCCNVYLLNQILCKSLLISPLEMLG